MAGKSNKLKIKKLQINLTNRWLYTLIVFFSLVVIGVFVYAVTPNPGHDITQIAEPNGCGDGEFLKWTTASGWTCAGIEVGGIDGSGTANYISKFTGATTVGNSVIYETASNVGIGTTSPTSKLDINSDTIRLRNPRSLTPTTGYKSPGTVVSDSAVGTAAWNIPNNAKISDNVYSTAVGGRYGATSHYLKSTNFGFSVPTGATIDGIIVQFERFANTADLVSDSKVRIVKADGSISTTDRKAAGYWSTTEAYYTYGSSSDKWGESWTAANINDADFGVAISTSNVPAGTSFIDHVRIIVYYTVGVDLGCDQGEIAWDANYIYVCVETNQWKKASLNS